MARFRDEWKQAVNEVLARHGTDGEPMSPRTAERLASRFGTLSHATINEWKTRGKVPADVTKIRLFADGLREYRIPLFRAAGIEHDPDEDEPSDETLRKERGDVLNQSADSEESERDNTLSLRHPRYFADGTDSVPEELQDFLSLGVLRFAANVPVYGPVSCGDPEEETQNPGAMLMEQLGADFFVVASGDSMEPHIHAGEYAAVRLDAPLEVGRIYVIRTEDGMTCKKYAGEETDAEGQRRQRWEPTNGRYAAILADAVTVRGRVVGRMHFDAF